MTTGLDALTRAGVLLIWRVPRSGTDRQAPKLHKKPNGEKENGGLGTRAHIHETDVFPILHALSLGTVIKQL